MLIIFCRFSHRSNLAQGRPGERHIENRLQSAEHVERFVRTGLCKSRLSAERTAERAALSEQQPEHKPAATAAAPAAAAEADTADEAEPDEVRVAGRQTPGAAGETETADKTAPETDQRWLHRVREAQLRQQGRPVIARSPVESDRFIELAARQPAGLIILVFNFI